MRHLKLTAEDLAHTRVAAMAGPLAEAVLGLGVAIRRLLVG